MIEKPDGAPDEGSVVRLKSGGPPMTVVGMTDTGMVLVRWYDDDVGYRDEVFRMALLERLLPGVDVDLEDDEDE